MEMKLDSADYNKLVVENDRLRSELEQTKNSYSRMSNALVRFRKEEKDLLCGIAALAFSHKEDNQEAIIGLQMLMVESGYCIRCGGFDCDC